MIQELNPSPKSPAGPDEISPREMDVLKLIGKGLGKQEIGKQLFIAEQTDKTHVTHLLEKLNLRDRTQKELSLHWLIEQTFDSQVSIVLLQYKS